MGIEKDTEKLLWIHAKLFLNSSHSPEQTYLTNLNGKL